MPEPVCEKTSEYWIWSSSWIEKLAGRIQHGHGDVARVGRRVRQRRGISRSEARTRGGKACHDRVGDLEIRRQWLWGRRVGNGDSPRTFAPYCDPTFATPFQVAVSLIDCPGASVVVGDCVVQVPGRSQLGRFRPWVMVKSDGPVLAVTGWLLVSSACR